MGNTFTYVTQGQAIADLSDRLYDTTNQFWSAAELAAYIVEGLRTWNAYTSYWRDNFVFPLTASNSWYDITSASVTGNNTLRPFTVTDTAILNLIEYHLLEPLTASYPLTWGGSRQFSVSDILAAMTRRQNHILGSTACTITQSLVNANTSQGLNTIPMPDTTIDIRRVAWVPQNNNLGYSMSVMRQGDIWEKKAFDPNYLQANPTWASLTIPWANANFTWAGNGNQVPSVWIKSSDPQPGFNPDYVPPQNGNYEVLSVQSCNTSNNSSATTLSIPDDWNWLIKWGALMDLLGREAQSKDAARAAYCQKRFMEGIKLLASTPAVLGLTVNDYYPLYPDAVRNGDDFNPLWESQSGFPTACYQSGLNLLGFNPPDSSNSYYARTFCVQNAPVPSNNSDYLQIARDDYDSLLDYAQHVAAFKMGGQEFLETIPLYQNFVTHAAQYNAKLKEMGEFDLDMEDISHREDDRNPMMAKE